MTSAIGRVEVHVRMRTENDPLERYVSSDVTLPEHLLFQLQCCGISDEETTYRRIYH